MEINFPDEFITKRISSLSLVKDDENTNWDYFLIRFSDGTSLSFYDGGQDCCEHRYMSCDDDLNYHVNSRFLHAETLAAKNEENDQDDYNYDRHDIEFLVITTDKGKITVSNHNVHNGYYGGFNIWFKVNIHDDSAYGENQNYKEW